jgi:pantoate--beta-alanine ligase
VVRRLVRDLDIPVHIAGVPTERDADGLALSSRNIYFSAEERRIAANLARVLRTISMALARDPSAIAREIALGSAALQQAGFAVEYLEIRESETLAAITSEVRTSSRVFAAVRLGKTRLIDNMPIALAA